ALTNYITGLGYPDTKAEKFEKFWPADLHVIGKDIVRFHTVYWPAFLMSAGVAPPKRVFGHGFLTVDGKKMSKSLGNVIDPFELIDEFGADPVRFYFLREVSFGHDGDYGREKFISRNNADLANDLGNLVQRSLSMIAKNCDAKVPVPTTFSDADKAILAEADSAVAVAREAMNRQAVHEAVAAIWSCVSEANRYFATEEPWAKKKTDPARMATILYVTAECVRRVSIAALAFVPAGAARILDALAVPEDERVLALANDANMLKSGADLPAPEPVFRRFERDGAV
ncbi:MAG: methionine--tRNA ligase, partial [Hyphomicrobiaceae bacterium]|nr:methionine--tRNA ligase [Hyphomicrobiaceae bacterium]